MSGKVMLWVNKWQITARSKLIHGKFIVKWVDWNHGNVLCTQHAQSYKENLLRD